MVNYIIKNKRLKTRLLTNDVTVCILASSYHAGLKHMGCPSLIKWHDIPILEYQIQSVMLSFPKSKIVVCCGYDSARLMKKKYKNVRYVENQIYDFTNDAEDLRLCLNNIETNKAIVIESQAIPSSDCLRSFLTRETSCIPYTELDDIDRVGLVTDERNNVSNFLFGSQKKHLGIFYLTKDVIQKYQHMMNSGQYKKLFMFEVLQKCINTDMPIEAILEATSCKFLNFRSLR